MIVGLPDAAVREYVKPGVGTSKASGSFSATGFQFKAKVDNQSEFTAESLTVSNKMDRMTGSDGMDRVGRDGTGY